MCPFLNLIFTVPLTLVLELISSFDHTPSLIDYMVDLSLTIEEHCERVNEGDVLVRRSLNTALDDNIVVSEEGVDSCSPSLMALNIVSDLVGSKAFIAVVLLSHIVWVLSLEEVGLTILAIPLEHVAEGVLECDTVSGDVVSVYLESSVTWVVRFYD